MKKFSKISSWLAVLALTAVSAQAQVIGNWANESTGDGWINWSGGQDSVTVDPEFSFVPGAVPGYTQSLQLAHTGWQQNLSIKLEANSPDQAYFFNNTLFSLTWSIPAGTGGGYNQMWGLYINGGGGYGFTLQPASEVSRTGSGSVSGTGGELDYWNGSPIQTQTLTWDYSSILPTLAADGDGPSSGYVELILVSNNGSGQPNIFDFENATLSSQVPEPSTIALGVMGVSSLLLRRRK